MRIVERVPAVPEGEPRPLKQGDRVRLSELGMSRHPRYAGREARVVGGCKNPGGIRVIWETSRTPVAMHKSFLQPLDGGASIDRDAAGRPSAITASTSCTSPDAGQPSRLAFPKI
jgi:hypothetical protein